MAHDAFVLQQALHIRRTKGGDAVEVEAEAEVSAARKPVVGVMSALPITGSAPMMPGQRPQEPWIIYSQLKQSYEVQDLTMTPGEIDPDKINVVLLLHPAGITPEAEFALDQYLLKGGTVIACVDPFSVTAQMTSGGNPAIKPDRAFGFDVTGVCYFADAALLSALLSDGRSLRLKATDLPTDASSSEQGWTCELGNGATIRELVDVLKRNYCGKVGYEYMHIADVEERRFLGKAAAQSGVDLRFADGLARERPLSGVERLGLNPEVGQFLGRAARGVHRVSVGLELRDGRAADAGGAADDRDMLGHPGKVAERSPRSNGTPLFRARKRPEANLRADPGDLAVAYFFLGALRGVFLSRFALSSSSVNFVATPAAGTSAFAVQTIALRTSVRWLSLAQPA